MRTPTALLNGLAAVLILSAATVTGTETENLDLRILPAPGPVRIDGEIDDWDLSGGLFACGDVEHARDNAAVWLHAMYDAEFIYILARWHDETPMNNPGSIAGDHGFNGDSLQVRFITGYVPVGRTDPPDPGERVTHVTAWQGVDGDVVQITYGRTFRDGGMADIRDRGGDQAFRVWPDGTGYNQEIRIPWALLTHDGEPLRTGQDLRMTFEPNFSLSGGVRLTIKDLFRSGVTPDRIFTFRAYSDWGMATLVERAPVTPAPVRLADGRTFPVALDADGIPRVDWTGLFEVRETRGHFAADIELPEDGFVSMVVRDADGGVVRHLLNAEFFTAGEHTIRWDGLTNPLHITPGDPVPEGAYTWDGIVHNGLRLTLRGWALNGGEPFFRGGRRNIWGGDHGPPESCAADGERIYLGWHAAEAGQSVTAVNPEGRILWTQKRGGIGHAERLAVAPELNVLFIQDRSIIYRLDTRNGRYRPWEGGTSAERSLADLLHVPEGERAPWVASLTAQGDTLYINTGRALAMLDARSGALKRTVEFTGGWVRDLVVLADGSAFALAALTDQDGFWPVVGLDLESGQLGPVIVPAEEADTRMALTVDHDGRLYVAITESADQEPIHQIAVHAADGTPLHRLGERGGWGEPGPWEQDRLRNPNGLAIDARGRLWVMEKNEPLRRVSVWDGREGQFVREHFGSSNYGCSGAALLPADPYVVVASGAEFRVDPETGLETCTGYLGRGASFARFARGANGRTYLALFGRDNIAILERVGEGDYRLRSRIYPVDADAEAGRPAGMAFWADANGDGLEQPEEVAFLPRRIGVSGYYGWSGYMNTDLTLFPTARRREGNRTRGQILRLDVAGFTAVGAPIYDLDGLRVVTELDDGSQFPMPATDNRMVVTKEGLNRHMAWFRGIDVESGRERWRYPNLWAEVHGSHRAPPGEPGLIRGTLGIIGSVHVGDPVGDVFAINTNFGEWHLLTSAGYYLSAIFEWNSMRWRFPEDTMPGVRLENVPSGSGSEDFGGSFMQTEDGRIFAQTGKTDAWIVEVTGWDGIRALPQTGRFTVTDEDVRQATRFQAEYRQEAAGLKRTVIPRRTPAFTGNLAEDFAGSPEIRFGSRGMMADARLAVDDTSLYLGFRVEDPTPWVNGADVVQEMYTHGDTVDFQLGTDPDADAGRREETLGDLRLSIGNFNGTPTAVIYRRVWTESQPWTAYSGVVRDGWRLEYVAVVDAARIRVDKETRAYTVQAAIPLEVLGLSPTPGLVLRGDLGVTFGDSEGNRTVRRQYWSNRNTGLVDDAVFELQLTPTAWGELVFD